jgi:hypothetical protein
VIGVIATLDNGRYAASDTVLRVDVDNVIVFALLFERHE